jgi:biopolymer transport protein ExbD
VKSTLATLALLLIAVTTVQAKPAFRTLHFLANGNYRFDAGPELTLKQLEIEIKGIAHRNNCADVHLDIDKRAGYGSVMEALGLFAKYRCKDLVRRVLTPP